MDMGELLTALENHIFQFASKQFDINDIPVTLQRMIMEAVYSNFQSQAIEQMIMNQIKVEGEDPTDKNVKQSEESMQETVDALNKFYGKTEPDEEGVNGGTEDSPAQEG